MKSVRTVNGLNCMHQLSTKLLHFTHKVKNTPSTLLFHISHSRRNHPIGTNHPHHNGSINVTSNVSYLSNRHPRFESRALYRATTMTLICGHAAPHKLQPFHSQRNATSQRLSNCRLPSGLCCSYG